MKSTLVVNLFGEPGVGKSTAATYIFSQLKMNGINCEYVSEFAKDKVYEKNTEVFKHQEYLFGKQSFKIARVSGKVDVIISDCPLFLCIVYNQNEYLNECFNQTVLDVFNSNKNLNILLNRKHEYHDEGRFQNEKEAAEVRAKIVNMLHKYNVEYIEYDSEKENYDNIVDLIIKKVGENNE